MLKSYTCGICKTKPDQISHHKSHLETEKHKDKKELFELKISKLNDKELLEEYGMDNVKQIVSFMETILEDKKELVKKNKKMNLEKEEGENELNEEETNLLKQMSEYNTISNREALKDKIHEIHNYLRNNGAGYGMNALKVFNILYGLKKIEENGLFEKVGLPEVCRFSGLVELAKNKMNTTADVIYDDILDALLEHNQMKKLLFYEVPKNMKSSIFNNLIKDIDNISKIEKECNVQLSGKIYEYFIGRDESAISELGAYFTDRHIVNYIYDKLNPQVNGDGSIKNMIDMFGGSGGFTTGYIHYLNKSEIKVNWESELKKVYHYDMNEDVIKSAGLEFFTLTGTIPEIGVHMGYKNSFLDEFENKKFDYIVTNPPYGGDKNKKSQEVEKQEKIKKYIEDELKELNKKKEKNQEVITKREKQLKMIKNKENQDKLDEEKKKVCLSSSSNRINAFAKKYNLKGNDKESVSLIQMMDMLEIEGTAIGVLKEGVFFDKKYKDIRKCLVQNFNVREVISVPQDQFENTSTKTSIVIFDNSEEKTSNVKFSELIVEKYEEDKFEEVNGWITLIESKGDICNVYDKVVSEASIQELLTNENVSLNGKDYNKKELIVSDEYELVKLGDICDIKSGKQLDKKNVVNGIFPVYGGGILPIGNHNEYNNENCTIVAGTGNCGYIQFYKDKFWASQCFTIKAKNMMDNMYIFYICKSMEKQFIEKSSGTVQKFIRATQFNDFKIPIPKTEEKMKTWVNKISTPYNGKIEKEEQLKKLENDVKNRITEISEKEECEEVELGKICEIKYGKRITKSKNQGSIYDAYGGGNIMNYKVNEYNRDGITYKISRDGMSIETCVTKIYGKIFLNDTALSVHSINDEITTNYIGEYLINIKDHIYKNCSHGSAQLHIDIDRLLSLKIKIPKNRDFIKALEPTFAQIETLQNEIKSYETLYKTYIEELSKDAIIGYGDKKESIEHLQLTSSASHQPLTKELLEKKDGKKSKSKDIETTSTISKASKSSKSSKSSENSISCGFIKKDGCVCSSKGKSEFNGRCGTHKNK